MVRRTRTEEDSEAGEEEEEKDDSTKGTALLSRMLARWLLLLGLQDRRHRA